MPFAEIDIDRRRHRVLRLAGDEAIGEPFRYAMLCELEDETLPAAELVGAAAAIRLEDGFGNERLVTGVVAQAKRVYEDASAALEVVVRPAFWRLGLGQDHRMFSNASALEVVERIVSERGERLRVEVASKPPVRETVVQFDESDLALVERLCDEEGWIWWLDHHDDSKAVLVDEIGALPFLVDRRTIVVREDATDVHAEESLHGLELRERAAVEAVRVLAVDRDAGGSAAPAGDPGRRLYAARRGEGLFERIEYAGSFHGRIDVEARAARRLEALASARRRLSARTTSVRPYPGRALITVGAANDGEYVVVRSRTVVEQPRSGPGARPEQSLECELELHPREIPLRLWRERQPRARCGVQLGAITAEPGREIAIDADGRVAVMPRWDRNASSRPARVAQRPTADSAVYPRVGWSVLTLSERDGMEEPTVLGRMFDAEHPPPYPLPGDKTKVVYQTATTPGGGSSNEIAFDGALGREDMFVHASGDFGSAANKDDGERVDGDATRRIARNETLAVAGDETAAVEGNHDVHTGKNQELEVLGAHGTRVDGDVTEQVGGTRSLHVGGEHGIAVGAKRSQHVGAAVIDATLGPIKAEAAQSASVLTGGVRVKVARGSVAESATLASTLLVGGVKLDIGGAGIKIDTKSALHEHVGGAVLMRTVRSWQQRALGYGSYRAAAVRLEATDITIEATGRILILAGASSIRVDDDGVEIRGSAVTASGDAWVAEGGPQTTWR
jgi:type VI secretion system secreted protein VgrG